MFICFDTEFTSIEKNRPRGLISIGLVAKNGREFYAELTDTWDESMCSIFVLETVLPLLDGGDCRMGVAEMASRLKEWIDGFGGNEVVLRSDAPELDWTFLQGIFNFHGWPKNLRKKCGTICFEEYRQQHRYNAGLENFWKDNAAQQHHALVDAKSLLFASRFAIKRGI